MFDGKLVANALVRCGATHVVWIPDSVTGAWDEALGNTPGLSLIRVCREGEALAVAAGLYLGGKQPVVQLQCTGLFEAGDALRNTIHDLGIPQFLIVGLRNYYASRDGTSADSAPKFAEAILRAWNVPYTVLDRDSTTEDLEKAYTDALNTRKAAAVFLAE